MFDLARFKEWLEISKSDIQRSRESIKGNDPLEVSVKNWMQGQATAFTRCFDIIEEMENDNEGEEQ